MASSVIHMCVANEINKVIKKDTRKLLIGSIAPDISKEINEGKDKSHFLTDNSNIPNLELFLKKYKTYLKDDFVLGYYIHLYTDYLWFKYFIPEFKDNINIYKIDGTIEKVDKDKFLEYLYNDYTNLNTSLLDEYNLDLSIFYENIPNIENIIEEIPINKIKIIIDKAGLIIKNSKVKKTNMFDLNIITKFITFSINVILENLKEISK